MEQSSFADRQGKVWSIEFLGTPAKSRWIISLGKTAYCHYYFNYREYRWGRYVFPQRDFLFHGCDTHECGDCVPSKSKGNCCTHCPAYGVA